MTHSSAYKLPKIFALAIALLFIQSAFSFSAFATSTDAASESLEIPACSGAPACWGEANGDAMNNHGDGCARKTYLEDYVTSSTAEEIAAQWESFTEQERVDIMAMVVAYTTYADELKELVEGSGEFEDPLPETERTLESSEGGVAVSAQGVIPADVGLRTSAIKPGEYNAEIFQYIAGADEVLFALDIRLLDGDESEWQPNEGEPVAMALDARTIGLVDGARVRLLHDHEGTVEDLAICTVESGTISFEMTKFSGIYIVPVTAVAENAVDGVIYFDLSAGNVAINGDSYTGWRFDGAATAKEVKGVLQDGQSYYVYQSNAANKMNTGLFDTGAGYEIRLPDYERVTFEGQTWAEYITDNTDVKGVINAWNGDAAIKDGRTTTQNRIDVQGVVSAEMVVDNLWSIYSDHGASRDTGAIAFQPGSNSGSTLKLRIKGDNRVECIHYWSKVGNGNNIILEDFGGVESNSNTITVADVDLELASGHTGNYWCSAIGGDDGSRGDADGIVINSGVVYAGTTVEDDCTAIGGGGNDYGGVTIDGGVVTAVASSSGTAIGGGIGKTSTGGQAHVIINDGTVYAYNFSCVSGYSLEGVAYIPAAAIGGGSSARETCKESTVEIHGGYVFARSVGGTAIGGGSSADSSGGSSSIIINGGVVDAASVSGKIGGQTVEAGAAIGGGTGGAKGNGGNCTLTISGDPTILTGSIGGGSTLNSSGHIGYATVEISGGDITGQFLMAEGGTSPCSFTMSGGSLHGVDTLNESAYDFVQPNGAAVYMDDSDGVVTLSGGTIANCSAQNGGAVYMTAGKFTISGTGAIENCSASGNGGAVYLGGGVMTIDGGTISGSTAVDGAGAYLGGGKLIVNGGKITANQAKGSGGGVLVRGGDVNVTGGEISSNTAKDNGGGISVVNGNYRMTGGDVSYNTATYGFGGGVYVSADGKDVVVDVLSGHIKGNAAPASSGGALAVEGDPDGSEVISVTIGVNEKHFNEDGATIDNCDHGDPGVYDCPVIEGNRSFKSGGAVHVAGNDNAKLYVYCLEESGNTASGENGQSHFMRVEGGKVIISASKTMVADGADQDALHGRIEIEGTMYVTGGEVEIWGDTSNPRIKGTMSVDIANDSDKFEDYRSTNGYYKLTYFENFTDPDTGIKTGQYKELEVKIAEPPSPTIVLISTNIYVHPGYQIVGWYTESDGTGTEYKPNKEYYLSGDLTVYAIWEANGYVVSFDPNVPAGESYEGEMVDQAFSYDEEKNLNANQYKRKGFAFNGWKDSSGNTYLDQALVKNLTTKREVVTLYAQWGACDHDPAKHTYTYSNPSDNVLKRTCSCGGYSETVTLVAEDAVYDGNSHLAELICDSGWAPVIAYEKKVEETWVALADPSVPTNAGFYRAVVSEGGLSAYVEYEIDKAKQLAPPEPSYSVSKSDDGKKYEIVVDSMSASPTTGCFVQYKVVHRAGDVETDSGWLPKAANDEYNRAFNLTVALTTYSVYVRYAESENYYASDPTPAESKYLFSGDVEVYISCCDGISYEYATAVEDTSINNGLVIKMALDDGYHLPNGFEVSAKTYKKTGDVEVEVTPPESPAQCTTVKVDDDHATANVTSIPQHSVIRIDISGAEKLPTITSSVTEGEVFGDFEGDSARISRDSAFTVRFVVDGYDSKYFNDLELSFSKAVPAGTSFIMVDKASGVYYQMVAGGNMESALLSSFSRMGYPSAKYKPSDGKLDLQFVVDFSGVGVTYNQSGNDATSYVGGGELSVGFAFVPVGGEIPEVLKNLSATASVSLADKSTFGLAYDAASPKFTFDYAASAGFASRWINRSCALVLEPVNDPLKQLPSDARVEYAYGNTSGTIVANGLGQFVIPMRNAADGEVGVKLVSAFLGPESEVKMNAKWVIANSGASTSATDGYVGDIVSGIMVPSSSSKTLSLDVEAVDGRRIFTAADTLSALVQWRDVSAAEIKVDLMFKTDKGEYVSTLLIKNVDVGSPSEGEFPVEFELNGLAANSYCLEVTVMDGIIEAGNARYYFIIQ